MYPMSAKRTLFISSILLIATVASALPASVVRRSAHRRGHVRRIAWNPVLRGSDLSMTRQNEEIDRLQLPRITDNEQLLELERTQELVPIEESKGLRISPGIQQDKRYARPWVNLFLQDMSS